MLQNQKVVQLFVEISKNFCCSVKFKKEEKKDTFVGFFVKERQEHFMQ